MNFKFCNCLFLQKTSKMIKHNWMSKKRDKFFKVFTLALQQCFGSVSFWCGSGSASRMMDPDPGPVLDTDPDPGGS